MNKNFGFSILEAIISVSIFTFCILFIWKIYVSYIKISVYDPKELQSELLVEEGIEVLKFMRDENWNNIKNLSTTTDYYLSWNGLSWSTTTNNVFIDGTFERKIMIRDVFRDSSQNIVSSGTFDPNSRKIVSKVSWSKNLSTTSTEIIYYISDIFDN